MFPSLPVPHGEVAPPRCPFGYSPFSNVCSMSFPLFSVACALIISTYPAINVVNYIPTRPLHKAAPAGNTVIGACPYPCPPPSVTHANQPPSLWHRHPHSRHPSLLSPCLSFRLPMRKGAAPKRDPFRVQFHSQASRDSAMLFPLKSNLGRTTLFPLIAGLTRGAVSVESRRTPSRASP